MAFQPNKVNYIHLRTYRDGALQSKGGVTVAWRQLLDETVEVAAAFCSLNDHYNKASGRTLAESRLDAKTKFYGKASRDDVISGLIHQQRVNDFGTEQFAKSIKDLIGSFPLAQILKYETLELFATEFTNRFVDSYFAQSLQAADLQVAKFRKQPATATSPKLEQASNVGQDRPLSEVDSEA